MLERLGVEFEVVVPEVEELREGDPDEVVVENARRKARAGRALAGAARGLVLGVDTDVVLDGRLLGKPDDEAGARERLEALSGRTHEVLSGVACSIRDGAERSALRPHRGHLPRPRRGDDRPLRRLRRVAGPGRRVRDPGPRLDSWSSDCTAISPTSSACR